MLINGVWNAVPGLAVTRPTSNGGPPWNRLGPDDYRARKTRWIRQIIIHTTGGHWPQPVLAGVGPGGHARQILEMWLGSDRGGGERIHSAAQIVVDYDGTVYCAADIATCTAYHAEMSNDWSVGIEMCTHGDGSIYQATIEATAALVRWLCATLGIPEQTQRGPYLNRPLARMELQAPRRQLGGPDCVGVFGHRDNTSERGRGDPGDAIWVALGLEELSFDTGEDLVIGRRRQQALVKRGAKLTVDGLVGPASLAAAAKLGLRWRDI